MKGLYFEFNVRFLKRWEVIDLKKESALELE